MSSVPVTISVVGHVKIADKNSKEVLLDKHNAIHNKNMAIAIARGLANEPPTVPSAPGINQIYELRLGNGGSAIDIGNMISYQAPNVTGASADLYNETYSELVDEQQAGTPAENSVTLSITPDPAETAIVIVTATIAAGEPSGQDISDSPPNTDPEADFAFDELGLFTSDGMLLTHIIFSPILKTANRELVITYTLTVSVT